MINPVFGKSLENLRKHRDVKLLTTERRRNYLVSEPIYHITVFHKTSVSKRNEKNSNINE